jgi:hypothetical protein
VARQLQIVETRALGPNRALHLVRVGGHAVLIGVTPDRINQLMQIDDPEEVERLAHVPAVDDSRSLRSLVNMLPGSLMRAGAPRARRRDGVPADDAAGAAPRAGRGARLSASVNTLLLRLAGVPRPAPVPARPQAPTQRQQMERGVAASAPRAAAPATPRVEDAGMFDATPPGALALRARSGYRESQINDVQRAIAQARAGVDLDRVMGRRAQ